jgi:methionine--tRNA ligase beta chain
VKPTLPFSEFSKLELLIGEIISTDKIEGADKLLLLQVDLGEFGKRQLVAGIAETHKGKKLKGKQVVVVANLEGKEIRGQRSEGMLLAADEAGKPILLKPERKVINGTRVR